MVGKLSSYILESIITYSRSQDLMRLFLAGVMWDITSGLTWSFCGSFRSEFCYIFHVLVCTNFSDSGAWLVASAFMSFGLGGEMLQGLSLAAGAVLPEETLLMKEE
jgi:hypothetical protein